MATKNELAQENHRLRAELDAVRLDAWQRADEMRAQIAELETELEIGREVFDRAIKSRDLAEATVATLTARNARLEKGLEHYAADETWEVTWGTDSDTAYLKYYLPNDEGWTVAREALAGTGGEK